MLVNEREVSRRNNLIRIDLSMICNSGIADSRALVKKIGCGLELNTDEMRGFMGAAGF